MEAGAGDLGCMRPFSLKGERSLGVGERPRERVVASRSGDDDLDVGRALSGDSDLGSGPGVGGRDFACGGAGVLDVGRPLSSRVGVRPRAGVFNGPADCERCLIVAGAFGLIDAATGAGVFGPEPLATGPGVFGRALSTTGAVDFARGVAGGGPGVLTRGGGAGALETAVVDFDRDSAVVAGFDELGTGVDVLEEVGVVPLPAFFGFILLFTPRNGTAGLGTDAKAWYKVS